jgi:DNA-binding PadR family transcriptional regulator
LTAGGLAALRAVGSLVAGLVEEEITDARRYRITESGLEALADWPA